MLTAYRMPILKRPLSPQKKPNMFGVISAIQSQL